ncbi:ABC transporter ATP-binding protein [Desulfobacterales bacterium HSG16]|nr:ABC transporter ATP-binding protein [Desulfobacterales bacterium HSG16]
MIRYFAGHFFRISSYLSEVLKKTPVPYKKLKLKELLFFFEFVKPIWVLGVISLGLMVVSTAISSLVPLSSKIFIDFIVMGRKTDKIQEFLHSIHLGFLAEICDMALGSINILIFFIIAITLISGILGIIRQFITLRFQQEITYNLQTELFDRLLRFPMSFFKKKQVGYLMARISGDISLVQMFFTSSVPQIVSNIFYIVFSFFILFNLNAKVAILLIGIFPIWAFIIYFFSTRVRGLSHGMMEQQAQFSKDMQETLSGVEVIKSHVTEKKTVRKLAAQIRVLFRLNIKTTVLQSLSSYLMKLCKLFIVLLVVWISVHEIKEGTMTIGDMTALIAYVMYLSSLANSLGSTFLMLQTIFAGMERLTEMFDIVPEYDNQIASANIIKPSKVVGRIQFENVSFGYERDVLVIKNASFKIEHGDIVALTGASGAGKTTSINLMLKFYQPDNGAIYLDDRNIKDIDTRWLRKQIGFVSQDVFLFNDTIENNIKYGNPLATAEMVKNASMNADADDFIEKLENGYQTVVEERGTRLSAGQRQRISIARAFLLDPLILIFDEPTSSLDAKTESRINNALQKLAEGRTTFIISHRKEVMTMANRVLVLCDGRISEIV